MESMTREEAFALLRKYNKDPFHIQHALTVEAVMKWYANHLGYGADAEYWGIAGLLHDIDFELYPEEHCLKAPELLREAGAGEDLIHSVVSHGYGITVGCGETIQVAPEHEMEKVLFAADELGRPLDRRGVHVILRVTEHFARPRQSLVQPVHVGEHLGVHLALGTFSPTGSGSPSSPK